jgi:hypothetical protein
MKETTTPTAMNRMGHNQYVNVATASGELEKSVSNDNDPAVLAVKV